jgi:hypothetical protein
MTPLKKIVRRRSEEYIRNRSQFRRLIVTIYPGGYIGIRLEKCRTEETITIKAVWERAVASGLSQSCPSQAAFARASYFEPVESNGVESVAAEENAGAT